MEIELQGTHKKKSTTWSGTWSNGLPNSYSDVFLSTAYNTGVNGSFSCNNLTINTNVTIAADTHIKVLGTLVTQSSSATLNIANKGEFILLHPLVDVSTVKLTANFTPQALLARLDYWFLTSPLSGITINSISPYTSTDRFYDYGDNGTGATGVFINLKVNISKPFTPAKGFLIRAPNNLPSVPGNWNITVNNISGGSLNKGIIIHKPAFYVDSNVGTSGFYIVGNPYLANIDLRKFLELNRTKISSVIWIWFKTNGAPETYVNLNAIESRSEYFSTLIRPFQAFMIKFTDPKAQDNELIFTPEMQIIGANYHHNYFNLSYKQSSINLPVGSCTYNADDFNEEFQSVNSDESLLSYNIDGKAVVICHGNVPYDGQIIALNYKVTANENYTISLTGYAGSFTGFTIMLIDTQLNTSVNLKTEPYTFAGVTADGSTDRFKIRIINI